MKEGTLLVLRIVGWATVPTCLVILFARMAALYWVFRGARAVVISVDWGFGHTITGPDVARRLFPKGRCVFIVMSEYGRHNPRVATIWPDIRVVFLPISFGIDLGGRSIALPAMGLPWLKRFVPRAVTRFARAAVRSETPVLPLQELYERIPTVSSETPAIARLHPNHRWPIHYFKQQNAVKAPPVRLPLRCRERIRSKLVFARPPEAYANWRGLCGLYLRQKGKTSTDLSSFRRVGSPLECYLPSIRVLNRAGYQVLLTGDVDLSSSLFQQFGGMLVDGRNLGVGKNLFEVFAATEADIFVGETGGGIWLPGLNRIPRLCVNAYPYGMGQPNSWFYYKTVRDGEGRLVEYLELFANHAFDYDLIGLTLHDNSAEEICEAVTSFIEDVARSERGDPNRHIASQVPEYTWFRQANARLSPAFLKMFEANHAPTGLAQPGVTRLPSTSSLGSRYHLEPRLNA